MAFATIFAILLPANVQANTQNDFENIYLFSDNQEFFTYESQAINSCSLAANIYDFTLIDDPVAALVNNVLSVADNSIVIVDIQKRLDIIKRNREEFSSTNSSVMFDLEYVFSTLKTNNCKIMFISGTDEDTFYYRRSFLNYVDVHVDTDFLYSLVKGLIYRIENNAELGIDDNFYIITDEIFYNPNDSKVDFTKKWVYPYFEETYFSEYYSLIQNSELLDETRNLSFCDYLHDIKKIRLYGKTDYNSTTLYNYLKSTIFNTITTEYDLGFGINNYFKNTNQAYFTGFMNYSKNSGNWCHIINSLKYYLPNDLINVMMLNTDAISESLNIDEYNCIGETRPMFFGEIMPFDEIFTFSDILFDFISDNDMQKYNNLPGQCDITYMPITIGDNGWIPIRMVKNCYQFEDPIIII